MFGKEKYQIEELSSTRVVVKNKSFWRKISKESIAKIVEDLNAKGKIVSAVIPFANPTCGCDYWIILR